MMYQACCVTFALILPSPLGVGVGGSTVTGRDAYGNPGGLERRVLSTYGRVRKGRIATTRNPVEG